MRIPASLFLLITLFTQACKPDLKDSVHVKAVYHWKSGLEYYRLREFSYATKVNNVFIRLFDIKYNPVYGAYPEAKFYVGRGYHSESDSVPAFFDNRQLHYTPVVYVQEKVLRFVKDTDVDSLASDIVKQVNFMLKKMKFQNVNELQLDCDWTGETKQSYFRLVELVKRHWGQRLSVTVKMYQYKYREKMGIPPADRAVLMCYNLEDLKDSTVENSIFSKAEFDRYMTRNNYPLPLDFALPAFSWARVYIPGKNVELLSNFTRESLQYFEYDSLSPSTFRVKNDLSEYGKYFPRNTLIIWDKVDQSDWKHIYQKSLEHINSDTTRYIYYQLNSPIVHELESYLAKYD
ncbi:MAG: hypothetical protein EP332_00220 [Bacteroidetes bacterium]|nr:MAG: hypothetical protein EP332_00220 [Bacteroidota bacterium]